MLSVDDPVCPGCRVNLGRHDQASPVPRSDPPVGTTLVHPDEWEDD